VLFLDLHGRRRRLVRRRTAVGDIADTVVLPVGGAVTYTAQCTIDPAAVGTLVNTALVNAPG
jgi:hypothetical protein